MLTTDRTHKMKLYIFLLLTLLNTIKCIERTHLPVIYKCCPINEFVGQAGRVRKVCLSSSKEEYNFSDYTIFSYEEEPPQSIHDFFKVMPDKFGVDEDFHESSLHYGNVIDTFNVYLSEKAVLYLEMPNAYQRWIKIYHNNFCIDFYKNRRGVKRPAIWLRNPSGYAVEDDDVITAAMLVSCFFLLIVLVVYALLAELRNLCGLILMAYVTSLFSALLVLAIIRMKSHSTPVCYGLTLVTYYFFLASFCWMTVMSYDIWWTFRGYAKARPIHRRGEPFKFAMYCCYAWGLPLAMTVFLSYINETDLSDMPGFIKPNLRNQCFISGGEKLLYLYVPMLILICANWLFYLMTAFNIWRLGRGTAVLDSAAAGTPAAHRTHRHRFLVYLKLSVVMGLNWVLEVVSFLEPQIRLFYIADLYNILIGVSIFLIFVCKRKVLRKLVKLYMKHTVGKNIWHPRNSTRSNITTSESSQPSQETQTLQVCGVPKGPGQIVNDF